MSHLIQTHPILAAIGFMCLGAVLGFFLLWRSLGGRFLP